MNNLEQSLIGVELQMQEAFNRLDVEAILKYFSYRIAGFSSTRHERFKGLDDLRGTFEYYLNEAETVKYAIQEPELQELGDTAVLSFYWTVSLIDGGKQVNIEGRGSHVFQREDGEWKIVHEHFSRAHHSYEK